MTNDINEKEVKKDKEYLSILTNGIFKENNVLVMMLGLCPALAITTTFENGLGMGLLLTLVLIMTNSTISALRKVIPNQVRIPIYIVIIATEVTIVSMLTKAFAFELSQTLGVFIPLITVNCIVFGRAEAFAAKNSVGKSAIDAIGAGLGAMLALVIAGLFREVVGTGTFSLGKTLPLGFSFTLNLFPKYAIPLFAQAPGAFIVLGAMLAITVMLKTRGAKK